MVFALAGDSTTTRLRANGDPLFIVGEIGRNGVVLPTTRLFCQGRNSLPYSRRPYTGPSTVPSAGGSQLDWDEADGWGSGWPGRDCSSAGLARATPPRRL